MDLQDVKRWQWMVIGLLVGTIWAATKLFYGIAPDGETTTGLFEMLAMTTKDAPAFVDVFDNGNVYVSDLEIHPPSDASHATQWVTGMIARRRFKRDAREWQTRQFRYESAVPFIPTGKYDFVSQDWVPYGRFKKAAGYKPPASKTYPTIRGYFDELNRKYGSGSVKYRYDWWESRLAVMTIYPLGGLLLIGGVWPTVVGLLVGAGFGSKSKESSMDLSRYGNGAASVGSARRDHITAKDRADLAAINAEIEKNLAATAGGAAPTTGKAAPEAGIRQLNGDATSANHIAAEKAARVKSFGAGRADFYPTEIHPEDKKE